MIVDLDNLKAQMHTFDGAAPFPHVVVDNFFDMRFAAALSTDIDSVPTDRWHEYDNPLEIKRTCNDWAKFPQTTYQVLSYLQTDFVRELSRMMFIKDLYSDPGLNGGGWHAHGRGGKLNVHQDYDCHPKLHRMQRRLNLIVYLNPRWQPEWGGALGLYGSDRALIRSVEPIFNRAILFDTRGSWHGLPEPVMCPEGEERQSLAIYYLTPLPAEHDGMGRSKVLFSPTPAQEGDPAIADLIARRARGEPVYRALNPPAPAVV